IFEFTLGLADEMVDLSGSNTRDLEFDPSQSAGTDQKFPAPFQCHKTALTFDLHFAGKPRHCNDCIVVFRQWVVTGSAHSFRDTHVKLALRFDPYLKSMLSILCFFRRHNREFNSLGLLENIIWHISRTLPFWCLSVFCCLT